MNETLKVLRERRSIRKYTTKQVEDGALNAILEAGTWAPTGMGKQSPVMVVVQDQKTLQVLSAANAEIQGNPGTDPFYGAPVVLVVLADKSKITAVYDGSLVMGNLMNAAHSLGIGSCWIHRAKEVFESEEGKEILKSLGIDGEYEGIGNCVLGYADCEAPAPLPRKENYVYHID